MRLVAKLCPTLGGNQVSTPHLRWYMLMPPAKVHEEGHVAFWTGRTHCKSSVTAALTKGMLHAMSLFNQEKSKREREDRVRDRLQIEMRGREKDGGEKEKGEKVAQEEGVGKEKEEEGEE